jgi:hypothetical protein
MRLFMLRSNMINAGNRVGTHRMRRAGSLIKVHARILAA